MPYVVSKYRPRASYLATAGILARDSRVRNAAYGAVKYMYNRATAAPTRNSAPAQPLKARPSKPRKRVVRKQPRQKRDLSRCKKAIKSLKQDVNTALGTITYRNVKSGSSLSVANKRDTKEFADVNVTSTLESITSVLEFFDPSNPAVLITASQSAGTYQRNVMFKSISSKIHLRNNYKTDARLKVYLCHCKDDTDKSPLTCWNSGVPDASDMTDSTDLLSYPSDQNLFNDLWRSKLVINTTLSPGQSITANNTEKDVEIDAAVIDSHNLSYQKEYKSFVWLILTEGTICHDTVASEQGIGPAGVDYIVHNTYKMSYNAGINLTKVVASNQLDNFTTSAVQSHQPVAANQPFGIA